MYFVFCVLVFAIAYTTNTLIVTIGYHRGLAHNALTLHPRLRRFIVKCGNWLTGIDPKAWVVMHRMHHAHSDTELDPHSPMNAGMIGIGAEQLRSYNRVIVGLLRKEPEFTRFARDLDFELNVLNRTKRWWFPYALHAAIGVVLAVSVGWLLGAAYFSGIMSHPIQGGLVNSFGHAVGGRNFDTADNSRNNHPVAWLIFGEGFQNNHHRYPASASFSYHRYEIDMGFAVCQLFEKARLLTIDRAHLIPRSAKAELCSSAAAPPSAGRANEDKPTRAA